MKLEEVFPALRAGNRIRQISRPEQEPWNRDDAEDQGLLLDDFEIVESPPQKTEVTEEMVSRAVQKHFPGVTDDLARMVCRELGFRSDGSMR